jgi:hypothetical protein
MARLVAVHCGSARYVLVSSGWQGKVVLGVARLGEVSYGWHGEAWRGRARLG